MKRSAWVTINTDALRHNLQRVRELAPNSQVMAVIKANAYGHGVIEVARALNSANGFAVSCIPEALELRHAGFIHPILVLQGCQNFSDFQVAAMNNLRVVIHDYSQLQLLEKFPMSKPLDVALKLDTGMHRLGIPIDKARSVYQRLNDNLNVKSGCWLMTHLACADDVSDETTQRQLSLFKEYTHGIQATRTIANSAGILAWEDSHDNWVRPGIMLYGSSPMIKGDRNKDKLKAVMSLYAPLIAVHDLKKGDMIGYGSTWECPEDMSVGVVACGYGDGYPRHARSGTPVWVNNQESQIIGRVSMDMVVIDLRENTASVSDTVELWGDHINVDRVAKSAGTIAYELLCNIGN